jgi:hypothetical protein
MEDIMPVTLPIEIYETLERTVGKEGAKAVIKSIENTISEFTEYKLRTSKDELLDVMRKEFVTKDFFEERLNALRAELLGIMRQDKAEIMGIIDKNRLEIEKEILRIDRKFTIMFIILFFTILFLNQNALEFIFRIMGLIR